MNKFKRKTKLIKPKLQLKMVLTFAGLTAFCLSVQLVFIASRLTKISPVLPEDGTLLMSLLPDIMIDALLLTCGILLPLTIAVGILVVFRVAGPIYRFERFLREVKSGKQVDPCKIRERDELQDFCELLNDVTGPLRAAGQDDRSESEAEPSRAA